MTTSPLTSITDDLLAEIAVDGARLAATNQNNSKKDCIIQIVCYYGHIEAANSKTEREQQA